MSKPGSQSSLLGTGVATPPAQRREYRVHAAQRKPCQLPPARYNCSFDAAKLKKIMEAEQLNTLTAKLGDLKARAEDLRRYL